MTPYAYAAMRERLRQAGELTPDHPDFWRSVLDILHDSGLTYAEIAKRAGTTRPSVSRWLNRQDKPKEHVASRLLRLLLDYGSAGWQGLGDK